MTEYPALLPVLRTGPERIANEETPKPADERKPTPPPSVSLRPTTDGLPGAAGVDVGWAAPGEPGAVPTVRSMSGPISAGPQADSAAMAPTIASPSAKNLIP